MLKKKLKKHGFADRLKYMRLLESGRSFTSINKEFGINKEQLQVLWDKYQMYGELGLQKSKYTKRVFALKRKMCQEWHICQKGRNAAFWWYGYGHDV